MFDYLNSVHDMPTQALAVQSHALVEHIVVISEGVFSYSDALCFRGERRAYLIYGSQPIDYGKPLPESKAHYGYCEECKAIYEAEHLE